MVNYSSSRFFSKNIIRNKLIYSIAWFGFGLVWIVLIWKIWNFIFFPQIYIWIDDRRYKYLWMTKVQLLGNVNS